MPSSGEAARLALELKLKESGAKTMSAAVWVQCIQPWHIPPLWLTHSVNWKAESPRIASRLSGLFLGSAKRAFWSNNFQFTYLWTEHNISVGWRQKDSRSWEKEDRVDPRKLSGLAWSEFMCIHWCTIWHILLSTIWGCTQYILGKKADSSQAIETCS